MESKIAEDFLRHKYLTATPESKFGFYEVISILSEFKIKIMAMRQENKPQLTIEEEIIAIQDIISHNLRVLRANINFSQKELSTLLKMTQARIGDIEQGRVYPTLEDLVKIVDYFQITFNVLLDSKIGLKIG